MSPRKRLLAARTCLQRPLHIRIFELTYVRGKGPWVDYEMNAAITKIASRVVGARANAQPRPVIESRSPGTQIGTAN